MTSTTYNQAILEFAQSGLADLATWSEQFKAPRTAAQESHYLCSWMVESLKKKRFSKLIADDLSGWIRMARSQGAGARLPLRLQKIVEYYTIGSTTEQPLGTSLSQLFDQLEQQDWTVITDTDIDSKLKLASDGSSSIIASASQLEQAIVDNELIKPVTLYVRGDETTLAKLGLQQHILFSQGDKKASLIKHHKAYTVRPANEQPKLCLMILD